MDQHGLNDDDASRRRHTKAVMVKAQDIPWQRFIVVSVLTTELVAVGME